MNEEVGSIDVGGLSIFYVVEKLSSGCMWDLLGNCTYLEKDPFANRAFFHGLCLIICKILKVNVRHFAPVINVFKETL